MTRIPWYTHVVLVLGVILLAVTATVVIICATKRCSAPSLPKTDERRQLLSQGVTVPKTDERGQLVTENQEIAVGNFMFTFFYPCGILARSVEEPRQVRITLKSTKGDITKYIRVMYASGQRIGTKYHPEYCSDDEDPHPEFEVGQTFELTLFDIETSQTYEVVSLVTGVGSYYVGTTWGHSTNSQQARNWPRN